MLHKLNSQSEEAGSGMPRDNLRLDDVNLDEIDSHVFLGQEMNMRRNIQPEGASRRAGGCLKFYSIIDFLKTSSLEDQACLISTTVLEAMAYRCKTCL